MTKWKIGRSVRSPKDDSPVIIEEIGRKGQTCFRNLQMSDERTAIMPASPVRFEHSLGKEGSRPVTGWRGGEHAPSIFGLGGKPPSREPSIIERSASEGEEAFAQRHGIIQMKGKVSHLVPVHVTIDVCVGRFLLEAQLTRLAVKRGSADETECLIAGSTNTGVDSRQIDFIADR